MNEVDVRFRETAAEDRIESVALSHLSVELGHLMPEDFASGRDGLRARFDRVAPWARTAAGALSDRRPRVSTCFLVDDYFTTFASPAEVVPQVLEIAGQCGLEIDYLARESGCVEADGVRLAELVAGRLTAVPPPDTNGSRPPPLEVGWLCNGQRSPADDAPQAMRRPEWSPPVEIDATNHAVFVDVELWSEQDDRRTWSCAYLAAVWQLMRLGLLRSDGASVVRPRELGESFPDSWDGLPPVVQLNPAAAAFSAYRTLSVLPSRFLGIEHAVRVVLQQFGPQAAVIDQITARSTAEGLTLPAELTERIDYVFLGGG